MCPVPDFLGLSYLAAKFDRLAAAVLDQQPDERRYDDIKINQYSLRTLELANIKREDCPGFDTFLGISWQKLTKHQLYASA